MSSRAAAVLLGLAGAALVGVAATRRWAVAAATIPGTSEVSVTGRQAAPAGVALALAAAAGAVVLGTAGRLVRVLVAAGLVVAGLGVMAVAVGAGTDPDAAVRPALDAATGVTSAGSRIGARGTAWPWIASAGGLAVALAGAAGLVRGRMWPDPARRFESPASSEPGGRTGAPLSDWDALSAGDDPTASGSSGDPPAASPRQT